MRKSKEQRENERKRRIFIIVLIVFSSLILLTAIIFTALAGTVDSEYDELLFESVKGRGGACYYVCDSEYTSYRDYTPRLVYTDMNRSDVRLWYSFSELPEMIKSGFIAVEDRKFYTHAGVDIKRTAMALLNCVFHFDSEFGASTITQQLIKNVSGDNERTFTRKFKEIVRAINIERNHTKEEILEVYMNIVPMGEGAVGIGAGAYTYFDKSPSELSLSECAMLVGITNAPTRLNPYLDYSACKGRRDDVLYCMHECGYIDDLEFASAIDEPIALRPRLDSGARVSNWFFETASEDAVGILKDTLKLSDTLAAGLLQSGGLHIYTTMDVSIQNILEEVFENSAYLPKETENGLETSFTVCDSGTGRLLGIIGSHGKKTSDRLINHATVPHTPGSALKPIALYAPLINDRRITPATVLDDVPLSFDSGRAYPKNYPNSYAGLTTVKDALIQSKNTVAMRLYSMLGAKRIYKSLTEDFGFDSLVLIENGMSDVAPAPLALGQLTYGVTPRALTEAYTVLANEGVRVKPTSIIAIVDNDGELLYEYKEEKTRIFDAVSARLMTQLLSNVVKSGTARTVGLKYTVDTAGKTGTSGDDRDRLFVGYTPYYTAGIWMGYSSGEREIGSVSVTHLEIWDTVMKKIHRSKLLGTPDEKIRSFSTAGLKMCEYCKDSGECLSSACDYDARGDRGQSEYFIAGTEPRRKCDRHVTVLYDMMTEALACRECPRENLCPISLIRVEDRSFPYEITVEDAGFVYRRLKDGIYTQNSELPYFYGELPIGEYAGKSRGRQKNRYCLEHAGE